MAGKTIYPSSVKVFIDGKEIPMKIQQINLDNKMSIRRGNVVIVKGKPYIVSRVENRLFLIDLENGNRWTDRGYDIVHDNTIYLSTLTEDELEVEQVYSCINEYINSKSANTCELKKTVKAKNINRVVALAIAKPVPKNASNFHLINQVSKDIIEYLQEENIIEGEKNECKSN